MNQSIRELKTIQIVGCLQLVILFIMASILYLERGSFMDVAFQTFEMIRTQNLAPQVYRFGSAFTQIFPLTAILLKAPLWMVAYMYSVGVILYQFLLFAYIIFVRKNTNLGFAYLLYLCLMSTHSFFWIQSEFSQSIPFGFAVLAFMDGFKDRSPKAWQYLILSGLIITAVFFHPLQAPLLVLMIVLWSMMFGFNRLAWISLFIILLGWLIKQYGFSNWYDNMAEERLDALKMVHIKSMFTPGFMAFCKEGWYYIPTVLLFGLCLFFLIRKNELVYSFLLVLGVGLYFGFIHITHPDAHVFYLENLLLAIPAVLSLVWSEIVHHISAHRRNAIRLTSILVFMVIFVFRIQGVSKQYEQRIAFYQDQFKQYGQQKIMLPESALPKSVLKFAWPTAYEAWMISTIQYQKTASLVYVTDTAYYRQNLLGNKQFRGIRNYPYDSLKTPYFIWSDTLTSYKNWP
ncbi:MAG: hypothetical protein ACR2IL_02055 [Chitinophagaceae bacterium]